MVRTLKNYSLCRFQVHNPVLLTTATILHIRSLEHFHSTYLKCCPLWPHFPIILISLVITIHLSAFISLTFSNCMHSIVQYLSWFISLGILTSTPIWVAVNGHLSLFLHCVFNKSAFQFNMGLHPNKPIINWKYHKPNIQLMILDHRTPQLSNDELYGIYGLFIHVLQRLPESCSWLLLPDTQGECCM